MRTLFNDGWTFAELALDENTMFKTGEDGASKMPVLFTPDQFLKEADAQAYRPVKVPHDWQIYHVQDLYKNSVGFYKKSFDIKDGDIAEGGGSEVSGRYIALAFEGVYMNSAVWVNGKKAGEWKYGYSAFEFDISSLVKAGQNEVLVIAVYQHCNTRWYSGAGIFRDVKLINCPAQHLVSDGVYFSAVPCDESRLDGEWKISLSSEVVSIRPSDYSTTGITDHAVVECSRSECIETTGDAVSLSGSTRQSRHTSDAKIPGSSPRMTRDDITVKHTLTRPDGTVFATFSGDGEYTVKAPTLWDISSPNYYILTTRLLAADGTLLDEISQHCGFKHAVFTASEGFFLNGRHVKIQGACHHHDHGALGAAFNAAALRRQFTKLKEMGVNAVRCSHNPPPQAWLDLCDEMGLLVDDEIFDMWEKPKTQFDYGNYFNDWCERDVANWVRRDRNHPSLIMWSVGNEIYDTHMGNGLEITKRLYAAVEKHDPNKNAQITIASNYMMTDGAQKCAENIDVVGYNYLERLYDEHHKKYPTWKIYGSETGSTVQSRGIYHFPDSLQLVTFSDGQCSTLGNCTTPWGCKNTQTVIANDRDCPFSAGQFIWTGWDYIGEPTPYHTKSSFFGQIDTAGFPKDTYFLYKSEWAGKSVAPFVHLLPYWDWNEGQLIDVKAYTNANSVELFFNERSLGRQEINHKNGETPFGQWQLEYHKGEIRAVAYDADGNVIAEDVKRSFGDPAQILLRPEIDYNNGLPRRSAPRNDGDEAIHFIQVMTADAAGTLVENARNYITINVAGDAELLGMDNGDSTDYEEYKPEGSRSHTRRLFANRLIAIVRSKKKSSSFVVTAASAGLPNVSIKYNGSTPEGQEKWSEVAPYLAIRPEKDFVPTRKIELIANGSTKLDAANRQIHVTAKVLPENASIKEISWNPVFKECISSDNITVSPVVADEHAVVECPQSGRIETTSATRTITAAGDGECILRCTAQNGTKYDEVISDLPFTVSGIGSCRLNPYQLIEACRFTGWDQTSGKAKPEMSLESGISNRKCGPTWVSFDKVDFGVDGADTIHLPIFSFATKLEIKIWDGEGIGEANGSKEASENLGSFTYRHESIYNTYSENVFTLKHRLFGVHTITISFETDLYLHGFYFDKTPKAYAKLRALDANLIAGDTFTRTADAVEGIGNNVNLDFSDMDFSAGADGTADGVPGKATSITICGKSNTENNTINIKFFAEDGSSTTQVIEFAHTNGYEEKTFALAPITGRQKISFVFLPGSNFDFKWFRFKADKQ
ncbi:glycoside hydrolase family 2 TIM barrel-domain containing protein [Treponema bryantii]|uniref:glycoside hydrolase family 2 TIM barrel-domain containing protein n=1 Tax=Treponema bryantii TaxID=163 RepID=UPI0003B4B194|nr:glycoside hydrolase family 2 TIM barrel-domain containing protein [Treponema bryantii]